MTTMTNTPPSASAISGAGSTAISMQNVVKSYGRVRAL